MKKLVLLVFALNICLGTFAQFTPGDTLKYRISLKDKAATDYLCKSLRCIYPRNLLNGEKNRDWR